MPWQEIVEFLGGATAISLTIGYLGKKAIEAFLQGRVESHKNELERIASEHSIRFQSLHTTRAEVISGFYEKLVLLDDTLHSTLRPFQAIGEPELKDKVEVLSIQFNEIREYFLPKRIFFEKNICELIDSILEAAKGVFYDITTLPVDIQDSVYQYDRGTLKERHEFWDKARKIHGNEITQLKNQLEDEFRKLLGIYA